MDPIAQFKENQAKSWASFTPFEMFTSGAAPRLTRFAGISAGTSTGAEARSKKALSMPLAYRLYNWRAPDRQRVSRDFHLRIAAAFRAKKPKEVRRLIEAHILEAREFLMRSSGKVTRQSPLYGTLIRHPETSLNHARFAVNRP